MPDTPSQSSHRPRPRTGLSHYLPILDWGLHYAPQDLVGDAMAGIIVAIMLIPQGMAYAMLAGLPPQVGLYASILPLVLYACLGTSRVLAVGPVAMDSLLVATSLSLLATPGDSDYLSMALTLALLIGLIEILMGVVRLGFIVNFLSQAVISGFTNGAALVIGVSQVKHLLGVQIPHSQSFFAILHNLLKALPQANGVTLALGVGSTLALLWFSQIMPKLLKRWAVSGAVTMALSRSGPLFVVATTTLLVWLLGWHASAGVGIVGDIPQGLPPIAVPPLTVSLAQKLLPAALTISFVGFMESIAVAKSLASQRRQSIDASQELIALGAANLGAAFTGGYPVTGGFSRSVVNFSAGANTELASIITAILIALVVLVFTPLFYYLPQAALAAIILVAVANLLDFREVFRLWRVSRADGVTALTTFAAVLAIGIGTGIAAGFLVSVLFYLGRTSRPHIAEVGRVGNTEHFRNIKRHPVQTCPGVLAIRVDESLYFANSKYLADYLMQAVAERPTATALVLICAAINHIDGSALKTLEALVEDFREAGITVYLSEVKGPVMDLLEKTGFIDHLGGGERVFLSTYQAITALENP
ncbi:SulP family inorganic anion transporter [Nodosilinea sp. PGN35]|uniref:SulP family inorganic anion transporter n=1 Tax=Nodosilinea sp. PGN35 TaxID=3020489 RepID=UPI0023B219D5|nr:sulfate permease [Nodosilinea sp. TSF1-S3]MDF0368695.1 sulfate permease [Nodosilinea sp. TSF1-S3]